MLKGQALNIANSLRTQAKQQPTKTAIVEYGTAYSYAEIERLSERAARNLLDQGVVASDVVVLLLPGTAAHVALIFALARIGAIAMPLPHTITQRQLQRSLANVSTKLLIGNSRSGPLPEREYLSLASLFKDGSSSEIPNAMEAADNHPQLLCQSSGTTGEPKQFLLSHNQVLARATEHANCFQLTEQDIFLQAPGLAFITGVLRAIMIMELGATLVLAATGSNDQFASTIEDFQVTFTFAVPARIQAMLKTWHGNQPRFPNLKLFTGSAPVARQLKVDCKRHITPHLLEGCGVNEMGMVAVERFGEELTYPDAVGRLVTGIEAEVVDANGLALPPDSEGELRIRKPHPFMPNRYLTQTDHNSRNFRDGWFYPGDIVRINADGYVFLLGRTDEVINRNGVKFYAREVEDALLDHPSIQQAAVIETVTSEGDQLVIAFVVSDQKPDIQAVMDYSRNLLGFRAPGALVLQKDLPTNPAGKVVKRELLERWARIEKKS
jgi:acyl-coenzyme A synthetase/AMP-(fatty) acid ligase